MIEIGKPLNEQAVVQTFLAGANVSETAVTHGLKNSTVERILRQAIVGLAKLNEQLNKTYTKEIAKV